MGKKKNTKQPAVKPPTAALSRKTRRAGKARASEGVKESSLFPNIGRFISAPGGLAPVGLQLNPPGFTRRSMTPREKGGMMRLCGTELVATLNSSNSALAITTYVLNARNATTFPKLSAEADVWVKHKFHELYFVAFGGSASTQAGTPAQGSLIFDILGGVAAPTTLAEIKNLQDAAPWHPWGLSVSRIPVEEGGLKWYTNDGGAAAAADALGAHYVGLPQTTNAGDITVDIYAMYDVEFTGTTAGSLVSMDKALRKEVLLLKEELEFLRSKRQ